MRTLLLFILAVFSFQSGIHAKVANTGKSRILMVAALWYFRDDELFVARRIFEKVGFKTVLILMIHKLR
ncbi:MAG: hypothetical protein KAG97_06160 [Victivallales bacterium]|nr:hypothetical protein [Victivallales bacterium]